MAASGVVYERGAWLYGDWKTFENIASPAICAAKCQEETLECTHWNFHVLRGDCELRKNNAGNLGYLERLHTHVTGNGPADPTRTEQQVNDAMRRRLLGEKKFGEL